MYRAILLVLFVFSIPLAAAPTAKFITEFKDGRSTESEMLLEKAGDAWRLRIRKDSISPEARSIRISPNFAKARVGEIGYAVFSSGHLCEFKERKDGKFSPRRHRSPMNLVGMKTPRAVFAAVVEGMKFDYEPWLILKSGEYSLVHDFSFERYPPYEDVVVDYYFIEDANADYSSIAKLYRNLQLSKGVVRPLKERASGNPNLAYAAGAPELRIRLAWKPAPSPVMDQTLENEPAMIAKVTFARVGELIDALKSAGVEKLQICLVGWNRKGHDGRYPQIFPVEEQLGGESALRSLIKKAKDSGYKIVCHTNPTSAYPVSELWDESYISKDKDGKLWERPIKKPWSGGRSFFMCMRTSYEMFAVKDFPRMRELGFKGLHYLDVVSAVPPHICYDPKHPLNGKESAVYCNKLMRLAQETFGGSQSECGHDHVASTMDYAFYTSFGMFSKLPKLCDKMVPMWQLVYNGIIMNNPCTETINYTVKGKKSALKLVELAGRPTLYINSAFFNRGQKSNWMGNEDILLDTPEQFASAVDSVKRAYADAKMLEKLQYEFFEHHEEISDGLFMSTFSDGTRIVCNYSDKAAKYLDKTLEPYSYILERPKP